MGTGPAGAYERGPGEQIRADRGCRQAGDRHPRGGGRDHRPDEYVAEEFQRTHPELVLALRERGEDNRPVDSIKGVGESHDRSHGCHDAEQLPAVSECTEAGLS
jgi:hypothetical protein